MSLEHIPQRGQSVAVPMSKAAYSITEFCALTGIGRTKAYAEIAAGRLHAKKVGSRTLITAESGKIGLTAFRTSNSATALIFTLRQLNPNTKRPPLHLQRRALANSFLAERYRTKGPEQCCK